MNPESTNSPNPVIPGSGPAIIRAPILNRVAAVMATWPWWAIVILVGLVAIFYSIFTSVVYTGAFNASVDNFKLSTNRFEVVSYAVRQTDGTTKNIVGTLTSQNNDSVTLITQDEVRELIPGTDVGSISCDSLTTQATGSASATACPLNSTVTVTRASIDGALLGQPSPGQYLITTGYGQTEVIAKIGVISEVRTPDGCDIDPQGTCQIKLTLKPDYAGNQFKGALISNSQGLLTIQTIPPIQVTLNKSDIVQENYTAPASGSCALNNIWVCKGLFVTMELTFTAFAFAIVLGLVLSLMRISSNVIMYNLATLYIEVVRGIPLLVLLLLVQFALPPWLRLVVPQYAPYMALLTGGIAAISVVYYLTTRWKHRKTEPIEIVQPVATSIVLGIVVVAFIIYAKATSPVGPTQTPPFRSAVIGLAVCYGAFLGELFRAGIQSVGRGQMEAGRSLGMTYIQAMRYIILPQAFRVILPALGNDFIAMLKDTSLVTILTVPEMTYQAQLYATKIFRPFEAYITIAVLYLVMTLFLSLLVRIVENRTRLPR